MNDPGCCIPSEQRKGTVMAEKQESADRPGGNGDATTIGFAQASEAVDKLRTLVEEASRSIKDFTQVGEQWAHETQERARGVARQLSEQGGRAVGTVSETVEHNPLASMAIAF